MIVGEYKRYNIVGNGPDGVLENSEAIIVLNSKVTWYRGHRDDVGGFHCTSFRLG